MANFFNDKICRSGIPLGAQVRKQIAKTKIYRIRPGNGSYGAKSGVVYQDKYNHFTPTNPQTGTQQAWRAQLTEAVGKWQDLSTEQKNQWRDFIS